MIPVPIVTELPLLCVSGARVLDIGTGTGRNASYLARNGFQIDALDGSTQAIADLGEYAEAQGLPVRTMLFDIRKYTPMFGEYAAVLWTFVLHFLTSARAVALLAIAREQASAESIHVIGAITTAGDFFRECPSEDRFYPNPGELHRTYIDAGWEILRAYEEERLMKQTHSDGRPMRNLTSFLIARKPASGMACYVARPVAVK